MMRTFLSVCLCFVVLSVSSQQSPFKWPEGKKVAISLTFDDGRLSQVDKGIPVLDKHNVKGTFYLLPGSLMDRKEGWKRAVANGHEIGNHSNNHPCTGNFAWSRGNALENYTLKTIGLNIDSCNMAIKRELGIDAVSFAFPCGQTYIGRGKHTKSYVPVIADKFETGRGWLDEAPNDPVYCDMAQLTGMELDGKSFEQVKVMIESARAEGLWLILAGHEMDDAGAQTSLLTTIDALCQYAADPANGIWIGTVHEVASYINKNRKEIK